MGISRSGRVRKKSSKLTDFQIPDDIDIARIKKNSSLKKSFIPSIKTEPELNIIASDEENDFNDGAMDFSDEIGDSDLNDSDLLDSRTKKSIYITEKSSKKKMLKDGKIVMRKGPRKDKGKSRFTAYMLWAKEVRQDMLYSHPEMDFASISKKLGEMWGNVPSNEKYNWKRRAKRLAAKGKDLPKGTSKLAAMSKFLNKNTPFKGKKPQSIANRQNSASKIASKTPIASTSTISTVQQNSIQKTGPAGYKVTGETNSDIAAYLKLLGDSLCLIGERLKEHEGQITVSGSLSVLLDSLLCSIGPLMCLTTYVPSLGQNTNHSRDVMRDMLDNIAYVMPGL